MQKKKSKKAVPHTARGEYLNMRKNMWKRILPMTLAVTLLGTAAPMVALADSSRVVTLGADLSTEQKEDMYTFFGTSKDDVVTIEVTNADERKYLEGVASDAQIGTRTLSCAYVQPTNEGGIKVKVANLTFVTSSMIASTLLTSGVENCNVVAACPIEVSGTGALTGIMMAYETASGETLSEEQKETATEELVTTGELAEEVGGENAENIMNEVKQEVIENGTTDEGELKQVIDDAASKYGVTLTDEQMNQIIDLMKQIGSYNYNINSYKTTINNIIGNDTVSDGFLSGLVEKVKGIFGGNGGSGSDAGILNDTNDSILGDEAVINSTVDAVKNKVKNELGEDGDAEGLIDRLISYFQNLLG